MKTYNIAQQQWIAETFSVLHQHKHNIYQGISSVMFLDVI